MNRQALDKLPYCLASAIGGGTLKFYIYERFLPSLDKSNARQSNGCYSNSDNDLRSTSQILKERKRGRGFAHIDGKTVIKRAAIARPAAVNRSAQYCPGLEFGSSCKQIYLLGGKLTSLLKALSVWVGPRAEFNVGRSQMEIKENSLGASV